MDFDASSSNTLVVYGHVGFDVNTVAGKVIRTVGGGAYYAALAAAAEGVRVSLVSIVGADFPEAVLKLDQVNTSASPRRDGPSAIFSQTYDDRNEVTAFDGELNVCRYLHPEMIPLGTAVPSAILLTAAPPEQQVQALEWLGSQKFQGLIAIDTTLTYATKFNAVLRQYGHRIGMLFVNAAEYEMLVPHPPPCTRIVLKRGNLGASVYENGVWSHVPAPIANRVHTVTGAGDVLAGSFLAGFITGAAPAEALTRAVAFATSYVESGAKRFYRRSNENSV